MATINNPNKKAVLPDYAIHIDDVYDWAKRPTIFGGKLSSRTVRRYSTHKLLPEKKRYGKEAYYDRRTVFYQLGAIELLNNMFKLPLRNVRPILDKVNSIPPRVVPSNGFTIEPIVDFYNSLVECATYAIKKYDSATRARIECDGEILPARAVRARLLHRELQSILNGRSPEMQKLLLEVIGFIENASNRQNFKE